MGKVFISLDLEMNKNAKGEVDKVIQIGAVAFHIEPFTIVEELSVIVNPNEPIDPFITKLTGITQAQADLGIDLQSAYGKLCELKIKHNAESYPVTWGGGDSSYLWDKVKADGNPGDRSIFGRRFFDVKTLYQTYQLANGLKTQSGLSKSMAKCGLKWPTTLQKHNALADALATAHFFNYFIEKMKNVQTS